MFQRQECWVVLWHQTRRFLEPLEDSKKTRLDDKTFFFFDHHFWRQSLGFGSGECPLQRQGRRDGDGCGGPGAPEGSGVGGWVGGALESQNHQKSNGLRWFQVQKPKDLGWFCVQKPKVLTVLISNIMTFGCKSWETGETSNFKDGSGRCLPTEVAEK